ncbi:MAG: putative TIM-barrel fold metal-dependent hydrolase [Granulosicoccus sp.]|jgi:predicted TIM-barrel fold metal-dependent hydrolase
MSHREDRVIHDADSHIIESRGWLESYASKHVSENLDSGIFDLNMPALDPVMEAADKRLAGDDPELTEALKADIFAHPGKRNMWSAYGAVEKKERSEAIEIMGISSQLIFPSIGASRFARNKDLEIVYGGCDALNRGMADFCADDPRLQSVGYLSLRDPEQAQTSLKLALELGINAIWIGSDAVEGRAPSHIAYDPLWAMMEEARVPVTLHIGSGQNMPSVYMNTGVERMLEGNLGNIESTKPKDMPVIHHTIERWITCMIYDGVLERFPKLKVGIIELGANWVPASIMNLDMGVSLLGKFDQALKKLSLKPSEYFQRQIRVAPLHTENTGWILRNVSKDILMFNTDYPHPEGGKDPFGDYERSLDAVNATPDELDRFYSKNYEDYLGLASVN